MLLTNTWIISFTNICIHLSQNKKLKWTEHDSANQVATESQYLQTEHLSVCHPAGELLEGKYVLINQLMHLA